MAKKIEHKYMVRDDSYKSMATGSEEIIQGYIDRTPEHVVRVRCRGERCYLTIKGRNNGDTRLEFEYEIPATDFDGLLSLCVGRILHKRRWLVPFGGFLWEVDEYGGDLSGLTMAEIEIPASDATYPLPPFIGRNVTDDPNYYNSNL